MFPHLPYVGFTWQITQHTGIVSADTIIGLLRGCAHLDGKPIDVAAIDARLLELGRLTSETGRSLWRDYQQVLSEFGFIVSSASNNGMLTLTPVAKELLAGRMSFGEAMTLQLLRYQYANGFKRTMPKGVALNDGGDASSYATLTELQEACGVRIRPFAFTWEVLDRLSEKLTTRVKLSVDEMARFVLRCANHVDVNGCCDAIIAFRNGKDEVSDPGDNVKRNAADWMRLLSMTSVFSLETDGRKTSIILSEQASVHAEALRWLVKNFNTNASFWKVNSGEDWFSFYGKIDSHLISLFNNSHYRLGWLMPSFIGEMKMTISQHSQNTKSIHAPRQLIIYGAPGTGKSWWIKGHTAGGDVIRTTFHPDSDYSTFVGAYKPSMEDDGFKTVVTTGEVSPSGSITKKDGLITQKRIVYKFVAQAFLKAYVEAWKKMVMDGTLAENAENAEGRPTSANSTDSARGNTDAQERVPPVYLVIEEINRGNCAQIFGDLFQLLDRNDEGFSEYEIAADDDLRRYLAEAFRDVRGAALAAAGDSRPPKGNGAARGDTRPPSADAQERVPPEIAEKMERVFKGEILLLPENLYIWATMNTSDQSLFPIDSAFKRRWEWKYMPIHDAQKGYRIAVGADAYDWWDFLDKANALVQDVTDSEDKKLGYFFCKASPDGTIPLERFVGKVVFYLWNDVFKDDGFDREVFADGTGGRLLFKDFFSPDGSPRGEAVRQFLENLGVGVVASSAGNAEGATTEPPAGGAENVEGQGQ